VGVAKCLQGHQVNLANLARLQRAAHGFDHRRVLVVVAGIEHAARLGGVAQHRARLVDRGRQRLFTQHVQPVIERRVRDRRVVCRRYRDIDEVELSPLGGQQRHMIFVDPNPGKMVSRDRATLLGDIGDRDDLHVASFQRPLGVARGVPLFHDEAVADDGASEGWFHFNFCRVCDRTAIE
jgi:hypothetical protein